MSKDNPNQNFGHFRTLALDIGDARVGLAISDPSGFFAQPLCSIDFDSEPALERIAEILLDENILKIVVGIPYEMDGTRGEQAKRVDFFIEKLREYLAARTEFSSTDRFPQFIEWDERLTTVEAERVVSGSKLKNKEGRRALDRVSASIILKSFLEQNRGSFT